MNRPCLCLALLLTMAIGRPGFGADAPPPDGNAAGTEKPAVAPCAAKTGSCDAARGNAARRSAAIRRPGGPSAAACRRIEAALDAPAKIECVDTPLIDVLDSLKKQHGIEIQLDIRSLNDVGVSPDAPVTLHVGGVSLRSALNLMLRPFDLEWIIRDEVLSITTPEESDNNLVTRVYPIGDLVVWYRDAEDNPYPDFDELLENIKATTAPTGWEDVGGKGGIGVCEASQALIVRETLQVHDQIEELLADLREAKKRIDPERQPSQPRRREQPKPPSPLPAADADNGPAAGIGGGFF